MPLSTIAAALPAHSLDLRTTPWFDTASDDALWDCSAPFPPGSGALFPQPGLALCHRQPPPPGLAARTGADRRQS